MTTQTGNKAGATFPPYEGAGGGTLCVAFETITVAAADTLLTFLKLPAGATVVGGHLMGADLDTGTEALDMDIGWLATEDEVADPDGFGNLGVITGDAITDLKPVAGIYYPLQGVLLTAGPKHFTKEVKLAVTVNTPANAGGTGALTLVVYYTTV